MRCSLCGNECSIDARFCASCGADLREQATGSALSRGERRQLTVMFCDLVDSTELSELLDLEDLQDVMRAYQESCARVSYEVLL